MNPMMIFSIRPGLGPIPQFPMAIYRIVSDISIVVIGVTFAERIRPKYY